MEVAQVWYLRPAPVEVLRKEEAAAALLDLAGVSKDELKKPRSLVDVILLGPELRRRGSELVLRISLEMKERMMIEVKSCTLATIRASATAASSSSSEQLSEVIKVTQFVGEKKLLFQFVPKRELKELMDKLRQFPPKLSVPLLWIPGVIGLHTPGCSCNK